MCLSLSKLGLPGSRTGIVIAKEETIDVLASMNSVISLAPGSFGAELCLDMISSGKIKQITTDIIRPYYYNKAQKALNTLHRELRNDIPWHVHKAEGAMFLWLWFKDLPISSQDLYEKLKVKMY